MSRKTVCGVLLTDEGIDVLGESIKPYLSKGPIGHYICCRSAMQSGAFMDMEFEASKSGDPIKDNMLVSVPLRFIKLVVSAEHELPIGFITCGQQET